ncbi:MAG TPA: orotidine-5'-phosphate decarboxylase, partial [Anaerolineae bacterium]|nr:orotidine-5'-phosphate decarboxylase [Anaerolineae bacterium]
MKNQPGFAKKLQQAVEANQSLLCVGLDPDPYKFPHRFASPDAAGLLDWGRRIIDATADLVCCYKPNAAFYEQFGAPGWEALRETIAAVPNHIPVLLDAKRGDIGSTATAYARAAFETLGADAVTVSPYLGRDAVAPFLAYPGKAVFVLGYTSNPSAAAIQEFGPAGYPLFAHVLREAAGWGDPDQVGFVVGATQPEALRRARALLGDIGNWILAPGVGAQGGDLAAALDAGLTAKGSGLIVPVSRSVIYADDVRAAARDLRAAINGVRKAESGTNPTSSFPSFPSAAALILSLHDAGCVQFGEFTLASGQQSPVYLDLRRIAGDPALLRQVAASYAALLKPLQFDRLAAVPYAALTIGTAIALATDRPLIYPRKEAKSYGTGQLVEGPFAPGERVAVIEDLVTSGGSVLRAVETLRNAGLQVTDVVVLIDREQGGPQNVAAAGCQLHAALTMTQVVATLTEAGRLSAEQAAVVTTYLTDPIQGV